MREAEEWGPKIKHSNAGMTRGDSAQWGPNAQSNTPMPRCPMRPKSSRAHEMPMDTERLTAEWGPRDQAAHTRSPTETLSPTVRQGCPTTMPPYPKAASHPHEGSSEARQMDTKMGA